MQGAGFRGWILSKSSQGLTVLSNLATPTPSPIRMLKIVCMYILPECFLAFFVLCFLFLCQSQRLSFCQIINSNGQENI